MINFCSNYVNYDQIKTITGQNARVINKAVKQSRLIGQENPVTGKVGINQMIFDLDNPTNQTYIEACGRMPISNNTDCSNLTPAQCEHLKNIFITVQKFTQEGLDILESASNN